MRSDIYDVRVELSGIMSYILLDMDLDLGLELDLDDVPDYITIDDIMCCFQGYPNRPAQPTTPNAHAPDPAVSKSLLLLFFFIMHAFGTRPHFRQQNETPALFAYAKGKSFYYCTAITCYVTRDIISNVLDLFNVYRGRQHVVFLVCCCCGWLVSRLI